MSATNSPPIFLHLADSDSEDDFDWNNNETFAAGKEGSLHPEEFRIARRKSSASRYGFDEAFIKLVATQCQLVLETEEVLGRGSFGTVVAASYQGVRVAAKIVDTTRKRQAESVNHEEYALDLPPHPHVVIPLEIFKLGQHTAIILLPRLRKGNLLTILNKATPTTFDNRKLITFASQIASALAFCHSQGLLHLDLKPQNVLIDFQDNVRISDFGNSRKLSDLVQTQCPLELVGTVPYTAPEIFCGKVPDAKADVYSFGITLWQMIERETPYFGENEHSIIYKVVAHGHRPNFSTHNAQNLKGFLKLQSICIECWDQDPFLRPDIDYILTELPPLPSKLDL